MKNLTTLLGTLLTLSLAYAQNIRFDQQTLFVKLEKGHSLPKIKEISQVQHLFGQNYILTTKDAVQLENILIKTEGVIRTEKNYYAGAKKFPVVESNKNINDEPSFESNRFNDPQVGRVWSFLDASKNGVSVEKAYQGALPNRSAEKIIVAVVDTGIDYNHQDLKDSMWINSGEIPGNGIDDDENGYIDDVHGIDTLKRDSQGRATGNPMDPHYHGTHVAGTIGATQNNGVGIAGIASHVELMAIKAVPSDGDETDRDVVESFLYAAKNGAKIINCSFGKSVNEGGMIVSETIKHIGEEFGVIVFAAAGNDSTPWMKWDIDKKFKFPASFENEHLIVIAASQSSGSLAYFSNVGKKNVDMAAPGQNIYSTLPNNKYGDLSGTSMATPTAVGVATQVLSYYPNLSPLELKNVLMNSVEKVPAFSPYMITGGRIDLYKAFETLNR